MFGPLKPGRFHQREDNSYRVSCVACKFIISCSAPYAYSDQLSYFFYGGELCQAQEPQN